MNVNVGVLSFVGLDGPPVSVVSSAATVNERVVAGGPVNAPSIARTENVYAPLASPAYVRGLDARGEAGRLAGPGELALVGHAWLGGGERELDVGRR